MMPGSSTMSSGMESPVRRIPDSTLRKRLRSVNSRRMANPHDNPAALKELQDSIYREKVLRARAMTPMERLESVFEISEFQFGMMHAGAMHKIGGEDEDAGWLEVRRGLGRLDRARDHGFYTTSPRPAA